MIGLIAKLAIAGLMGVMLAKSWAISVDRQVKADYEKCLSWQADGHNIRCSL